jgi:hypothetical protein
MLTDGYSIKSEKAIEGGNTTWYVRISMHSRAGAEISLS